VVEAQGVIATNAHVARPYGLPSDLTVETQDGHSLPARLLGADEASDVALLKIDDTTMAPLEWGDSNAVRVGQETWAIGNPLDIGISIARGTISGSPASARSQPGRVVHPLRRPHHARQQRRSAGRRLRSRAGVSDMIASEDKGQDIPSVADGASRRRSPAQERRVPARIPGLEVKSVDAGAVKRLALKRTDGVLVESVIPGPRRRRPA